MSLKNAGQKQFTFPNLRVMVPKRIKKYFLPMRLANDSGSRHDYFTRMPLLKMTSPKQKRPLQP